MASSNSVIDISVAITVDELCKRIQDADDDCRPITRAYVAPQVYDSLAQAKAKQHVSRGNPVLLLALEVVSDTSIAPGEAKVG